MPERLTKKKVSKHGAMYAKSMHGGGGAPPHPAKGVGHAAHPRFGKAGHVVYQAPTTPRKKKHADRMGTKGYKRGKSG